MSWRQLIRNDLGHATAIAISEQSLDGNHRVRLAQTSLNHAARSSVTSGVGKIETLIDQREVRDDVARYGKGHRGPVLERR